MEENERENHELRVIYINDDFWRLLFFISLAVNVAALLLIFELC